MTFNMQRPVYVDGNTAVIYAASRRRSPTVKRTTSPSTRARSARRAARRSRSPARPPGASPPPPPRRPIARRSTWRSTAAGPSARCRARSISCRPTTPPPPRITIAAGTYHEIVYFTKKSNVTLHGPDRNGTIIAGTNNNTMNPSTRGRALVGIDSSTGLIVRNLTIHNLTPQGGSQAEALRLRELRQVRRPRRDRDQPAGHAALERAHLRQQRPHRGQRRLRLGRRARPTSSTARSGPSAARAPIVQARNPATGYGYVFVDSKLTADAGLTGNVLARIDVGAYPGQPRRLHQLPDDAADRGGGLAADRAAADVSRCASGSTRASTRRGNAINVGSRLNGSKQLTAAQAAMMRDPSVVLAGWQPPAN